MSDGARTVLVVGPLATTGGVTRYVRQLLGRSSTAYTYRAFNTARREKRTAPRVQGYGVILSDGWIHAFRGLLVTLSHMTSFPMRLRALGPQLVHVCGCDRWVFWENAYYMLVCKAMGFPVTMHYMGPLDQYWERCGWIERMLVRRVLHVPAGFAVMSQRALRALLQITPGARAVVVPSSVDPHVYAHAASRLWDADGKVRMLFVGGQGPYRKGLHELLAAAKVLWSSDSPLVFIVTGPVAESAARQAGEWVGKNVLFTGTIPEHDMIALYHSVDVLVLPSHNEGLPYVVVEAMASGLPIISSTVGGLPEVIQHEETGLLVRPGDVQGLASAIAELVDDASKRKRMGDAGRSFAEAHLSSDACLAVLERFFDETLNRTPRVAAQDCNEN